jgi:hypothetical protein
MRPDEFAPGSVANVTTFNFDRISPPSGLYVQRDDKLNLFMDTNVAAGDTVNFVIRFLRVPEPQGGQPDQGGVGRALGGIFNRGIVQPDLEVIPIASIGGLNRQINLAEGYLLSVGALATTALSRGRTFVRATLMRPAATLSFPSQQLFGDYVTNLMAVGWPGGRTQHSTEGPGFLRSSQVATPAAGADWTFTAGVQQRLRIISLQAQLAVANSGGARPVEVILDDGANIYARMAANTTFPVNATSNLNFSNSGTPSTSVASDIYAQAPSTLVLPPGHRIRSNTTNIVVGDTWTNIFILAEEWLDAM